MKRKAKKKAKKRFRLKHFEIVTILVFIPSLLQRDKQKKCNTVSRRYLFPCHYRQDFDQNTLK